MFRKFLIIALALVSIIGCAVSGVALCHSEDGRPGIVGVEHADAIKELDEAWNNGEFEVPYHIEMVTVDGYWVVFMEGQESMEGYYAAGFYDHYPSEDERKVLWANRMLEDEFYKMADELGF